MRASVGSRHLSGAERIIPIEKLEDTAHEFVARALGKGSLPDRIVLGVDALSAGSLIALKALDLVTLTVQGVSESREAALKTLEMAGVSEKAVEDAMRLISTGAALSGENMRGAMIMDARTGERLEPDRERGVRASRFDWTEPASNRIDLLLADAGLTHFRTKEALALATKVAHAPAMVAELCWSDDPDYTAGYVASIRTGYVRFPFLKEYGDPRGGRAFFVNGDALNTDALIEYLQKAAVRIAEAGTCRSAGDAHELFRLIKHDAQADMQGA